MRFDFGITRTVLLFGGYAVKVPQHRYGWRKFLQGLLANDQEAMWWRETRDERLCPVLWSLPLGLMLVQRRVERNARAEELPPRVDLDGLPLDYKPDNFGWLDGRLVLFDYGS